LSSEQAPEITDALAQQPEAENEFVEEADQDALAEAPEENEEEETPNGDTNLEEDAEAGKLPAPSRAWARCDHSKGGRVSATEFKKCGAKIFKKCTLKRMSGYIKKTFTGYKGTNGLDKKQWNTFFRKLAHVNRIACARPKPTISAQAKAWKLCDKSRGGRISPSEWKRCGPMLFKKCTIKRHAKFASATFRKFKKGGTNGLDKKAFAAFYRRMALMNRSKCGGGNGEGNKSYWLHKVHHINNVARLHYCLNKNHHVVPCSHIMDNFSYSRTLIGAIMKQLPRFVHKHTVVYRMYTTLKLYYLHQQELLSEILSILKLHMHSKSLARVIFAYIRKMHGGHYGWVGKISMILKSYMKMNKNQMHSIVQHHRLVYQLHSIIRHAATHSHRMIHKLYHVMSRHGFAHHSSVVKTFHKMMRRHVRIIRKIRHTKKVHHTRTVTRHHRKVVITRSHHSKTTTKHVSK
jgi:hypothetical protein